MLVTFKSAASADIMMLDTLADLLLQIIGKRLNERGVLYTDELAPAIKRLEAAIDADKQQQAAQSAPTASTDMPRHERDQRDRHDDAARDDTPLSLAQRAYPLLDMMRRAQRKKAQIIWGL